MFLRDRKNLSEVLHKDMASESISKMKNFKCTGP